MNQLNGREYTCVGFERRGRVLVIELRRPEHLNAVNGPLHTELAHLFADAQADADSQVLVLTGAGRAFSAGGDLAFMQASIDEPALFERSAREARDIVFSMLELDKPVICRLNGHAMGLGATLALLCDIVVADERARIGDPHVAVGLVAGDGGALLWPHLIGHARARRLLFTGDAVGAAEAAAIGLISQAVPAERLDAVVDELATRLAAGATQAIRWTKVTCNLPLKALFHSHFDAGIAYEVLSQATQDHQEAVHAFRDRRKPVFRGQ